MFHKIFSLYEFGALCALTLQCYKICHMGTLQKAKPRKTPLKIFHFPALSGRPNSTRLFFFLYQTETDLQSPSLLGTVTEALAQTSKGAAAATVSVLMVPRRLTELGLVLKTTAFGGGRRRWCLMVEENTVEAAG